VKFVSILLLSLLLAMTACATRPAPEISGDWKPVNHFPETPQSIPLYQSYVFYPSPIDRTLKSMLTRWARDSKRNLSYLHPSDFTLYRDVAGIRSTSLGEAVARLNAAYAAEKIAITVDERQIVVSLRGEDEPAAAKAAGAH
jgi:hypothetical protein